MCVWWVNLNIICTITDVHFQSFTTLFFETSLVIGTVDPWLSKSAFPYPDYPNFVPSLSDVNRWTGLETANVHLISHGQPLIQDLNSKECEVPTYFSFAGFQSFFQWLIFSV